jgi:hypothetical protein
MAPLPPDGRLQVSTHGETGLPALLHPAPLCRGVFRHVYLPPIQAAAQRGLVVPPEAISECETWWPATVCACGWTRLEWR